MSSVRGCSRSRSERNKKTIALTRSTTEDVSKKDFFFAEAALPFKKDSGEPENAATPFLIPPIGSESEENRDRERVFLTHFVSPGEFYVQDSSAQLAYKNIQLTLVDISENKETVATVVEQVEIGKLYAVKLADSSSLERCKVLSQTSPSEETFTVQLIDVGPIKNVSKLQLIAIDTALSEVPPAAKLCHVWGLHPAGHYTKWSFSSTEWAQNLFKTAAAYIKVYHTEKKEEFGLTSHFVRLFFEQIQQGGALECDQYVTICYNDSLFASALAIRQVMLVTVQPSNGWPAQREFPKEFTATLLYFDDDARVYLHPIGPYDQKVAITELLNWYYPRVRQEEEELNGWVNGQACIVKGLLSNVRELNVKENELDDTCYYRGTVHATNEEEKKATVYLIDYARYLDYSYDQMFKRLIAFEYAPQAWRCGLSWYPGEKPVQEEELAILERVLLNKECFVSVKNRGELPLVDIIPRDDEGYEIAKVYNVLRPEIVVLQDTPTPTPSPDINEETFLPVFSFDSSKASTSKQIKAKTRRVNPLLLASDSDSPVEEERSPGKRQTNLLKNKKPLPVEASKPKKSTPTNPSLKDYSPSAPAVKVLREKIEIELPASNSPSVIEIRIKDETAAPESKAPIVNPVSLSSTDAETDEEDCKETEMAPQFNFEHSLQPRQSKIYHPLRVPLSKLLPLRILKIIGISVCIQPTRYRFKDGPSEWEAQFENFNRLQSELQRAAPRFPNLEEAIGGNFPCACLNPNDNKWYRGVVTRRKYGSPTETVVKLIDIYEDVKVANDNIKQLPAEYLDLPENARRCRVEGTHSEEHGSESNFPILRTLIAKNKQFYGVFKLKTDSDDKKILTVNLRYKDENDCWISAVDNMF